MPELNCHAPVDELSNREAASHLLLKVLGPRRVAGWCNCGEAAIYKWLSRGTDEQPIPPEHVPAIMSGAAAEGLEAPLAILWPKMAAAGGVL